MMIVLLNYKYSSQMFVARIVSQLHRRQRRAVGPIVLNCETRILLALAGVDIRHWRPHLVPDLSKAPHDKCDDVVLFVCGEQIDERSLNPVAVVVVKNMKKWPDFLDYIVV